MIEVNGFVLILFIVLPIIAAVIGYLLGHMVEYKEITEDLEDLGVEYDRDDHTATVTPGFGLPELRMQVDTYGTRSVWERGGGIVRRLGAKPIKRGRHL